MLGADAAGALVVTLSFLPRRVGRLISDLGIGMTLRKQTEREYNPHDDQTDPAFTDYPCAGIIAGPTRRRKIGGSEETDGMKVLLRADGLAVVPAPGDKIVIDGIEWTIARNDMVRPAGKHILHKLELRP
jgi:hypothetical protein